MSRMLISPARITIIECTAQRGIRPPLARQLRAFMKR